MDSCNAVAEEEAIETLIRGFEPNSSSHSCNDVAEEEAIETISLAGPEPAIAKLQRRGRRRGH